MALRAAALVVMPLSMVASGCGAPPPPGVPLHNERAERDREERPRPPEVLCSAGQSMDGHAIVRYLVRNVGRETLHVLDGSRMPYQIARDDHTLVILHGVNGPVPDHILVGVEIPLTRPLAPGEVFIGEARIGEPSLRNHYEARPAPPSLLHGPIRVRCEVGWGTTPIVEGREPSIRQLLAWQQLAGDGPFDVVLP